MAWYTRMWSDKHPKAFLFDDSQGKQHAVEADPDFSARKGHNDGLDCRHRSNRSYSRSSDFGYSAHSQAFWYALWIGDGSHHCWQCERAGVWGLSCRATPQPKQPCHKQVQSALEKTELSV